MIATPTMHTTWAARFLRPGLSGPRSFSAQRASRPTRYSSAIAGGRCGWRRLKNVPLFFELWLQHQRRDAYWKHGSVREDYEAIQCPVYVVGGWTDGYTNAIPRLLEGLTVPR